MIFSDFRPAEYHAGKTSYVAFYVINPETGVLVRKRIKVNRVGKGQNRDKYARTLCCEINRKLYEGWNPFLANDAYFSGTSIQKGIRDFLETKGKNVRPDTFRSYHSYLNWFNGYLKRSGKGLMPVKTFTDRDAEKAMKELGARSDIGAATYNSYLEFFRNLFNYFIARNWLKENPFKRIEKRREEQKRRDLIPPHIRQQIADYFVQTQQIPYLYIMQLCYRCLIRPDKDNYKKGLPYKHVKADEYQMNGIRDDNGNLTHNQVLVIDNVFSGGEVSDGNIVRDTENPNEKEIPNGSYDIVDNHANTYHPNWFRLDKQDSSPYNDKDDNSDRDGFRLHLGTISFGCVTIDASKEESQKSWNVLSNILNKTSATTVNDKRGHQWMNPLSRLTRYGTLKVIGTDNLPSK